MNARALHPAELTQQPAGWLTAERANQLVWAFLWLGLLARSVRYFLRFPLWDDESFLCVSFIDASYADLLRPLGFHQVAPLLFLWLELTCVKLLGYNEWSLRLPAFLASIGSLFLFRRLADVWLAGWARVAAIAGFAVSYGCIRYAAEAKPYGIDLFVALVLLSLALEFQRKADQARWLWLAALFAPLAVGLSFPAAFVGGGVSLHAAAVCRASGHRRGWPAWLAYNVALVGAFAGFYALSARVQGAAEADFMHGCWQGHFPPLTDLARMPGWLLEAHTSNMFAFPVGGDRGASALTAIALGVGIFLAWRHGQRMLLLACLAPLGLQFVAAALERYPYGGHVKFGMFAAPGICLLAGLGAAALVSAAKQPRTALHWQRGLLVALSLVAIGSIARDVAMPYKTTSDQRARDFARWFWLNAEREGEAVCLKSDWDVDFSPATWSELTWAAMYRCNRAIYSPRQASGHPPQLDQVTDQWPLRCVEYRSGQQPYDEAARQDWLRQMQEQYDLAAHDSYPLLEYGKFDRILTTIDHLEVYKFVPKSTPSVASPPQEAKNNR
ncbi:MAG: hypothetical protein AB7O62_21010 [Pirellulales bacterium]